MIDDIDASSSRPVAPPGPFRVVCIGSAALDVLMEIDVMPPPDGRIAALDGMLAGGGPAATAAVTLARLGVPTELVAVVGDDMPGDIILAGLARAGVGTRWVRRASGARSALSMGLIAPSPANTRSLVALSARGTAISIDDDALEACRHASWIHVDHAGWPLVASLRADGVRTPISVDGGNPLTPERWSDADLYVPGEAELLRSTGCTDVGQALAVAADRGATASVVTLGAAGSRYLGLIDPGADGADGRIRARRAQPPDAAAPAATVPGAARYGHAVPSPVVEVRSTLGAGDVYHGALLAGLLGGGSINDAMNYASTAAALSCRGLDGRSAIPTHDEVVEAMHLTHTTP